MSCSVAAEGRDGLSEELSPRIHYAGFHRRTKGDAWGIGDRVRERVQRRYSCQIRILYLEAWYNGVYPFGTDLKALSMIERADWSSRAADRQLLAECKAAVREVAPEADLILYGSRARGDARDDSDYDLLVLVDRDPDLGLEKAIVNRLVPLEVRTGKVLTVLVYSRTQWDSALYRAMPFHKNVTREGVSI